jgi:hypothetical protein
MAEINIKMPSTPRTAYDPQRPANGLLLNQARELEKAVVKAGRRVVRKSPKTEEQVAAYIRHLNRALHQQLLLPKKMKRRPVDVTLPPAPKPRGASPTPKATGSRVNKKVTSARKRRRSRS